MLFPFRIRNARGTASSSSIVRSSSFLPRLQGIARGRSFRRSSLRPNATCLSIQRTTAESVPREARRRRTGRRRDTLHAAGHLALGIATRRHREGLRCHRNPAGPRSGRSVLPQQLASLLVVLLLLNLCTASRSFVALHDCATLTLATDDGRRSGRNSTGKTRQL